MVRNLPLHPRPAADGPVPSPHIVSIDCHDCRAPQAACADCVVTMLLPDESTGRPDLSQEEQRALSVLSDSGLVPPLRYQPISVAPSRRDGWGRPSNAV